MRLRKFTHACVRLERDGRTLLIDPGVWTEPEAYDGVSDILVTHEHADHVDPERLATIQTLTPSLTVYAPAAVAQRLTALGEAVVTVAVGDDFTANGFAVAAVGGTHAEIYEGLPGCANLGYIVDSAVYHPGDALHVPRKAVLTLLVPTAAPWLKLAEALDFVRAVAPKRAYPIHDAMFSDIGLAGFDNWMRMKGGTEYARLSPGESAEL
jgi:L-ascorbate metabolism protein UlaG (beta-lactamase superfamily)